MGISAIHGMRVLVTGGTGFVGRHLLRTLHEGGAEITCLVRAASRRDGLPPSVRFAQADLATPHSSPHSRPDAALDGALAGQDAVIHMAALLFGSGWQDYLRSNVLAADSLGQALARREEVRRVVLVSSLAATGPCAVSPGVTDATPPAPVSAYGWSKFMAEQTLARYVGPRLVTLRPPIIYGSGDRGLLPCFRSAQYGLVVTPGLGRSFPVSVIHVHDVVRALVCCLAPTAHGVYHCHDGAEHTMAHFGLAMAAAQGRTARVIHLPLPIMGAVAALSSLAGRGMVRLGMRAPSWNRDKYREARQTGWLCAGTRLCQEQGFVPAMPLAEGLREAVRGYRALGWLSP